MWIFNAKSLLLNSITDSHEEEILDISVSKTADPNDSRNNLLVSCSRDKTVKCYKYYNGELLETDTFSSSSLPVIGVDFVQEDTDSVKLVYIDAKSNLCLREIRENCTFEAPIVKNLTPRKFFSLAVQDNKIAIGTDTKIQFGELKAKNYWALMKSAGGNHSKMKDFVKLEIDDTDTFVLSS